MDKLFKYNETTFGVLSDGEDLMGLPFTVAYNKENEPINKMVVNVVETRVSKGQWKTQPRTWSKIQVL